MHKLDGYDQVQARQLRAGDIVARRYVSGVITPARVAAVTHHANGLITVEYTGGAASVFHSWQLVDAAQHAAADITLGA